MCTRQNKKGEVSRLILIKFLAYSRLEYLSEIISICIKCQYPVPWFNLWCAKNLIKQQKNVDCNVMMIPKNK